MDYYYSLNNYIRLTMSSTMLNDYHYYHYVVVKCLCCNYLLSLHICTPWVKRFCNKEALIITAKNTMKDENSGYRLIFSHTENTDWQGITGPSYLTVT